MFQSLQGYVRHWERIQSQKSENTDKQSTEPENNLTMPHFCITRIHVCWTFCCVCLETILLTLLNPMKEGWKRTFSVLSRKEDKKRHLPARFWRFSPRFSEQWWMELKKGKERNKYIILFSAKILKVFCFCHFGYSKQWFEHFALLLRTDCHPYKRFTLSGLQTHLAIAKGTHLFALFTQNTTPGHH